MKRFPLPKSPSAVTDHFAKMCGVVSAQELGELRQRVVGVVDRLGLLHNELIAASITTAAQIALRCSALLDLYDKADNDRRRLIIGAARYFVEHADAIKDETPLVGFDDDILVLNHVLEQLGVKDQFIE